jgi:hypothetical protein
MKPDLIEDAHETPLRNRIARILSAVEHTSITSESYKRNMTDAIIALLSEQSQRADAPEAKPVAWAHKDNSLWMIPAKAHHGEREEFYTIPLYAHPEAKDSGVTVPVTDAMALALHRALSDGDIDQSDIDEIKTGLRAAMLAAAEGK